MSDQLKDIRIGRGRRLSPEERVRIIEAFAHEYPETYELWKDIERRPKAYSFHPFVRISSRVADFVHERCTLQDEASRFSFWELASEVRARAGDRETGEQALPSDGEILSYATSGRTVEEVELQVSVRANMLGCLYDYLIDALQVQREDFFRAGDSARSSDAGCHSEIFRMFHQIGRQVSRELRRTSSLPNFDCRPSGRAFEPTIETDEEIAWAINARDVIPDKD